MIGIAMIISSYDNNICNDSYYNNNNNNNIN
jgi:hypothetical protein